MITTKNAKDLPFIIVVVIVMAFIFVLFDPTGRLFPANDCSVVRQTEIMVSRMNIKILNGESIY